MNKLSTEPQPKLKIMSFLRRVNSGRFEGVMVFEQPQLTIAFNYQVNVTQARKLAFVISTKRSCGRTKVYAFFESGFRVTNEDRVEIIRIFPRDGMKEIVLHILESTFLLSTFMWDDLNVEDEYRSCVTDTEYPFILTESLIAELNYLIWVP